MSYQELPTQAILRRSLFFDTTLPIRVYSAKNTTASSSLPSVGPVSFVVNSLSSVVVFSYSIYVEWSINVSGSDLLTLSIVVDSVTLFSYKQTVSSPIGNSYTVSFTETASGFSPGLHSALGSVTGTSSNVGHRRSSLVVIVFD
jgi:hypothetical protein